MTISSTTRQAGPFTGNDVTVTFAFTFKVFSASDLQLVRTLTSTGVSTTLTITTDYTVTLNADQNSAPGGSVTLTSPLATGYTLIVTSDISALQSTDLTNQGGFYPQVITNALDKLTILVQQIIGKVGRSLNFPIQDTNYNPTLPAKAQRVGRVLAFDATTGDPAPGPTIADVGTVGAAVSAIETVAANIASVNTDAASITSINTVSGSIGNVNTVGGSIANVSTVAGSIANVNAVAGNATNINAVAGNATNINAVAANSTNINSVVSNASNINTVAGSISSVNTVATNNANVVTVAGSISSVNTVSTNIAAVNNASTNMSAIIDAPNQASAAAASAAAAAASAASGMYSAVQDKSANYTVALSDAGDLIRMTTTSSALTVTLPAISGLPDGFNVTVVKWTGDANNVTVQRSSSDTINGSTSYVLDAQYKAATFVADKETSTWFASGSGSASTNIIIDAFTGDGTTTAFTLSGNPGSKNNTLIDVGGVFQLRSSYSWSGSVITFSSAPPSGALIEVQWSQPLAIGTPADGSVTKVKLAQGAVSGTAVAMAIVFGGG